MQLKILIKLSVLTKASLIFSNNLQVFQQNSGIMTSMKEFFKYIKKVRSVCPFQRKLNFFTHVQH